MSSHSAIPFRQLDDIIECPICLDIFDDPRLLPCGHSCCLRCLEQLGNGRKRSALSRGSFTNDSNPLLCPICRKQIWTGPSCLPSDLSNRIRDLPKNFSIQKLLHLVRQSTEGCIPVSSWRKTVSCDECSARPRPDGIVTSRKRPETAIAHCTNCNRKLCNVCLSAHMVDKLTVSHLTVPLCGRRVHREVSTTEQSENFRGCEENPVLNAADPPAFSVECSRHSASVSGAVIQFYCQDCRQALCVICFVEAGHSSHCCMHAKDAFERLSLQLLADAKSLASAADSCHQAIDKLVDESDVFVNDIDRTSELVRRRVDELKSSIDAVATDILARIDVAKSTKLSRSERAKNEIGRVIAAIDTLRLEAEAVVKNRAAGETVKKADDIHDETARLVRVGIETVDEELSAVNSIRFTYNDRTEENFNFDRFIGNLDTIVDVRQGSQRHPNLIHCFPNAGGGVYAMTLLGNRLFVVRHGTQHIEVYDVAVMPMTLCGCLPVHDLGAVSYGLAASAGVDRCLYVSDYNANLVHRVDLTETNNDCTDLDDYESKKWTVGTQPAGLSVTEMDSLLVTCYGAGEIQEYRRDQPAAAPGDHLRRRGGLRGKLPFAMTPVRVIRLPPDIAYPWHAICLPAGCSDNANRYVVTVTGTTHGVYVIDANGLVDRKFDGCTDDDDRRPHHTPVIKMKSPRSLSFISGFNGDWLLAVADQINNRILILDRSARQLSIGKPVVDRQDAKESASPTGVELQLPGSLCFDAGRSRIYVGEWIGGRILVFDGIVEYVESVFSKIHRLN